MLHRFSCLVTSVLLLFAATTPSLGQSSFEMVRPTAPPAGTPEVIGGEPADPVDWPATFIFTAGGGCTSTAIGERVILTAAHCVEDGAVGRVSLGNDVSTRVTCHHHPGYPDSISPDFALCVTNDPLAGFPFERVSGDLARARVDEEVLLLGFGCTQNGGHDNGFGVLYTGRATVRERPHDGDLYLVTEGGAALCFGDSGGAAYAITSPDQAPTPRRVAIGVNSRGDISKWSFLSSTATESFVGWAFDWASEANVEICGLHRSAEYCRP